MHSVGAMLAVRAELMALLDDLPAVVRVYSVLVRHVVPAVQRAHVASLFLRPCLLKGDAMIRQLMLFERLKCLDLQAYLHVPLYMELRFQHVSAYSLRKTSGSTKD